MRESESLQSPRTLYRMAVSVFGVIAIKVIRVPSQSLTLAQTAMQSRQSIRESRAMDSFDLCGSSLESPEHWSIGI